MHDLVSSLKTRGQKEQASITMLPLKYVTPGIPSGQTNPYGRYHHLVSSEKLQGIAPGQFGVIYDKDSRICFGSGEIIG